MEGRLGEFSIASPAGYLEKPAKLVFRGTLNFLVAFDRALSPHLVGFFRGSLPYQSYFKEIIQMNIVQMLRVIIIAATSLGTMTVAAHGLPDFTSLVENNRAAVVNISTTQKQATPSRRLQLPEGMEIPELPENSQLRELFRYFFGEEGEDSTLDSYSLGSGFIISDDGYLISNAHVIKSADEIMVRLSDGRELVAQVIGTDKRSDVAVLKINATDLPTVRIGTGYDLKVGEWVLAIGSPFGFDHSVTVGVVSAKGRSLPRGNYVPFIQTDVAINPGNSGGPLFDLDGKVVGVNSQIFSRTGGFMGLSFAIPIEVAMDVAMQLRDHGRVSRGWLGVLIQNVTQELAESFGMDRVQGALVAKVLRDSPADKAGLKVGDIVVEFDRQAVEHSHDLPPIVGRTRVGQQVPVQVLRNGDRIELQVIVKELPAEDRMRAMIDPSIPGTADIALLGLVVNELSDQQLDDANLIDSGGVIVDKIRKGPARRAGIREQDIILILNKQPVATIEALEHIVRNLPRQKSISVLVQRNGNPEFLALKIK